MAAQCWGISLAILWIHAIVLEYPHQYQTLPPKKNRRKKKSNSTSTCCYTKMSFALDTWIITDSSSKWEEDWVTGVHLLFCTWKQPCWSYLGHDQQAKLMYHLCLLACLLALEPVNYLGFPSRSEHLLLKLNTFISLDVSSLPVKSSFSVLHTAKIQHSSRLEEQQN